jgi:hypothetical protein
VTDRTPRIVTEVSLTPGQIAEAMDYARQRREYHRGEGAAVPWAESMGTLGEMAVASLFGVLDRWRDRTAYGRFSTVTDSPADVGDNVQVRTIDTGNRGLAVRKTDPPDAPYVLVIVAPETLPAAYLLGWAWGY